MMNDATEHSLASTDSLKQAPLKRIAFLNCNSQRHDYHWPIVAFCSTVLISSLFLNSKSINEAQATLTLTPADSLRIASLINHQPDQPFPAPYLLPTQSSLHKQPAFAIERMASSTAEIPAIVAATSIQQITVQDGDSLGKIFKRLNISSTTLHLISQTNPSAKLLFNIKSGDQLEFEIGANQQLVRLLIPKSLIESVEFTLQNETYSIRNIKKTVETHQHFAEGVIENSFYLAAQKAGLNDELIMELVEVFTWDIDFSQDIHRGDHFEVLYEQKKVQGQALTSQILAARFTTNDRKTTAIAYTDANGDTRFYTPQGMGMKKPFKRNPVDFARISSHFNAQRFHPILHTMRAHKGVDYAAKTGTPIKSTGDGKIIFAGRKGGYGNTVVIQHGENITTLYGHLHKFAPNIKVGDRVKQDQVIGQVGSSGLATGPHLHYEFLVDGKNKNPLTVALAVSEPIKVQHQVAFKQRAREYLTALDHRAITRTYAQLDKPQLDKAAPTARN